MNAQPWFRLPWYWASPSLRWLAVTIFAGCSAGAIAIAVFADEPDAAEGAMALYGCGLIYLWAFFFSLGILLAIDARRLRLPGVQRQINASLVLYGVLGIIVPLFVPGVDWSMAAVLALFSVGGLTFALMPRYLALAFALTPSLANALWKRLDLPGIDDPGFAPWAALTALVLLLGCAWRWRQLLHAGSQARGWSSPMVLQFRNGAWSQWHAIGDNRQLRQRPDWLQPGIDLAGTGPAKPRKTLRVALGGWYLPQTARSYSKQFALMFGILAVPAASIVLLSQIKSNGPDFAATLAGAGISALSSLSVMAAPAICIFSLLWLGKRWKRTNAELPLLALLPGLGDSVQVKRSLLRTALGLPLALHALLVLLLGMIMLFWHDHAYMLSFMLLAQLGGAAVTTAVLLNLLGGRPLSPWRIGLILAAAVMLTMASLLLPAFALGQHPMAQALPWLPLLPLGWLLFAGPMVWLCRRGWRGFVRQPHPFLAG